MASLDILARRLAIITEFFAQNQNEDIINDESMLVKLLRYIAIQLQGTYERDNQHHAYTAYGLLDLAMTLQNDKDEEFERCLKLFNLREFVKKAFIEKSSLLHCLCAGMFEECISLLKKMSEGGFDDQEEKDVIDRLIDLFQEYPPASPISIWQVRSSALDEKFQRTNTKRKELSDVFSILKGQVTNTVNNSLLLISASCLFKHFDLCTILTDDLALFKKFCFQNGHFDSRLHNLEFAAQVSLILSYFDRSIDSEEHMCSFIQVLLQENYWQLAVEYSTFCSRREPDLSWFNNITDQKSSSIFKRRLAQYSRYLAQEFIHNNHEKSPYSQIKNLEQNFSSSILNFNPAVFAIDPNSTLYFNTKAMAYELAAQNHPEIAQSEELKAFLHLLAFQNCKNLYVPKITDDRLRLHMLRLKENTKIFL